jgi:hypothetical protein
MFILHIPGYLLKERHKLQKLQLWVTQIIHGNGGGGRGEDGPSSSIITLYFGFTNLTKKTNETQQMFIEYLVFYICKGL